MILHRLRLLNFRQHSDTELLLGPGITSVIGPNGSGKTTLLEGIAWALYGSSAARGTKESLRWNLAPPRSQVRAELNFGLGSHEYRVTRSLYDAELYQDGAAAPSVTSHQEVSTRIERLLGMNRDEFFNTYFTGQKELAIMATLTAGERARFLSRILGYDRLRDMQEVLRDRRSVVRGELQGLEQVLGTEQELKNELQAAREQLEAARQKTAEVRGALEQAERGVTELTPEWERQTRLRDEAASLDSDIRLASERCEGRRTEVRRLQAEVQEGAAAEKELEGLREVMERYPRLKAENEQLEQDERKAGARRRLLGKADQAASEIERLEKRVTELADADDRLAGVRRELQAARDEHERVAARLEAARVEWVRDRQDVDTRLRALLDQHRDIRDHRDQLRALGPDGTCPTCRRQLGAEFDRVVRTLDDQLEEIEMSGKYFRQRLEQLRDEPEELQALRKTLAREATRIEKRQNAVATEQARVRELAEVRKELARRKAELDEWRREIAALPDRYDPERHDAVRSELRALEPEMEKVARLQYRIEGKRKAEAALVRAQQAFREAEREVESLRSRRTEMGYDPQRFEQVHREFDRLRDERQRLQVELASVEGEERAAASGLRGVEERLESRKRQIRRRAELRTELRHNKALHDLLADLRTELNTRMRPEISEVASAFLSELTDGRYDELELDESYQVTILEDAVSKRVISGGEEDLANLVLRLAISQMVAERAGHPLSLLVLDEIFGSLDEVKRENVIDLLRGLADRFPQVILISHVESVKDGADRVLRVSFDERTGASRVTEETGGTGDEDLAA